MSAEKFFQRESAEVLFVPVGLFGFLRGVSGSVLAGLACACMLFSVKFHVVKREVRMLQGSAGREISKEEGVYPLMPSSTMLRVKAVWVLMPNRS